MTFTKITTGLSNDLVSIMSCGSCLSSCGDNTLADGTTVTIEEANGSSNDAGEQADDS